MVGQKESLVSAGGSFYPVNDLVLSFSKLLNTKFFNMFFNRLLQFCFSEILKYLHFLLVSIIKNKAF